jgi:hypothetical protein
MTAQTTEPARTSADAQSTGSCEPTTDLAGLVVLAIVWRAARQPRRGHRRTRLVARVPRLSAGPMRTRDNPPRKSPCSGTQRGERPIPAGSHPRVCGGRTPPTRAPSIPRNTIVSHQFRCDKKYGHVLCISEGRTMTKTKTLTCEGVRIPAPLRRPNGFSRIGLQTPWVLPLI